MSALITEIWNKYVELLNSITRAVSVISEPLIVKYAQEELPSLLGTKSVVVMFSQAGYPTSLDGAEVVELFGSNGLTNTDVLTVNELPSGKEIVIPTPLSDNKPWYFTVAIYDIGTSTLSTDLLLWFVTGELRPDLSDYVKTDSGFQTPSIQFMDVVANDNDKYFKRWFYGATLKGVVYGKGNLILNPIPIFYQVPSVNDIITNILNCSTTSS